MPFYDDSLMYAPLRWDNVFKSPSEFISKVVDVGGITDVDDLTELYTVLAYKYVTAETRYSNEFSFIMALKRELYTEFPFYLKKKELAKEMMAIEIAEVQKGTRQLRNLVDQHDEPVTNADSEPIDDLSTTQEHILITNNKLEAIKNKYNVMNRNYLSMIYKRVDELFKVVLADDNVYLYEQ